MLQTFVYLLFIQQTLTEGRTVCSELRVKRSRGKDQVSASVQLIVCGSGGRRESHLESHLRSIKQGAVGCCEHLPRGTQPGPRRGQGPCGRDVRPRPKRSIAWDEMPLIHTAFVTIIVATIVFHVAFQWRRCFMPIL